MRPLWTMAVFMIAAPTFAAPQEQFEVVSVKPNSSGAPEADFYFQPVVGLKCINVTLKNLILFAYNLREQQLVGP